MSAMVRTTVSCIFRGSSAEISEERQYTCFDIGVVGGGGGDGCEVRSHFNPPPEYQST